MEEPPKKDNLTLEFLQKTKFQIADLTKRVAEVTKSGIASTTGAIQSKVVESKERSKKKKEERMESLKNELRDDGFIDIAPPMMVLPDVDAEQLELMNSQNEAQIQIVEEMVRLSERIDLIERRLTSIGSAVTRNPIVSTKENSHVGATRSFLEISIYSLTTGNSFR